MQLLQDTQRCLDHDALLHGRGVSAIHIRPASDNDGGLLFDARDIDRPRIRQRFMGNPQRHVMIRLAAIHSRRQNAIRERIEFRQFTQVAAPFAVSPVGLGGFRIPVEFRFPIQRRIADRVDLMQDVFPVLTHIRGTWKDARHTDNRDVFRICCHVLSAELLLYSRWMRRGHHVPGTPVKSPRGIAGCVSISLAQNRASSHRCRGLATPSRNRPRG